MELIKSFNVGTSISHIEFHPTKSIMLTVGSELFGRKLTIWRFDNNENVISIPIEFLGNDKLFLYFHPKAPELYIFGSYDSWKLSKMYICNYDTNSVSFSNRIQSFVYLRNYYEPLKINGDGSFECIKHYGGMNHFCKFVVLDFEIYEIEQHVICKNSGMDASLWVIDFLKIGADVYFYSNACIFKQTGDKYKIIYQTTNKISRMYHKNGFIIFIEKMELKFLDLETLSVDMVYLGEKPVDFCVI